MFTDLVRHFSLIVAATLWLPVATLAADRTPLHRDARAAHPPLNASMPAAKSLSKNALAVLVFPSITKAGLGLQGNKFTRLKD